MSVHVVSWAFREAPVEDKHDLLVLLVLAEHAHEDGSGAWPSVATIAKLARLSPRRVQYALRQLEAAGIITTKPRAGSTTLYGIVMTPAPGAGVHVLRPAQRAGEGRTSGPQGAHSVRPNRQEPSRTVRGRAQARDTPDRNLSELDAEVQDG